MNSKSWYNVTQVFAALFQTLINVLITIVLSSGSQTVMESLPGMGVFRNEHGMSTIPQMFCSEVVKLVAMQMQALGVCTEIINV